MEGLAAAAAGAGGSSGGGTRLVEQLGLQVEEEEGLRRGTRRRSSHSKSHEILALIDDELLASPRIPSPSLREGLSSPYEARVGFLPPNFNFNPEERAGSAAGMRAQQESLVPQVSTSLIAATLHLHINYTPYKYNIPHTP